MKHTLWIKKFKKSSEPTRIILNLFLFLFLTTCYLLLATNTSAQIPPRPYVKCDDARNPEFQSMRPYQASPCDKMKVTEAALFCGNKLVLSDEITVTEEDATKCSGVGGKNKCTFVIDMTKEFAIDLSDAEFPIMGNTELVMNSQQKKGYVDELDNPEKVNEYVSWYLSGVPYKPEYQPLDMENLEDIDKLVNYSGPVNKLLPWEILAEKRITTIRSADVNTKIRHDQIVVCAKRTGILSSLGIGSVIPYKCYLGENEEARPKVYGLNRIKHYRDYQWKRGSLVFGGMDVLSNFVIDQFASLFPDVIENVIKESIGDHWVSRMPPLSWNERYKDNPQLYQKHYNEWRGKSCVIVPLPFSEEGWLICIDNPIVLNKWSDLFPYIPLASTEDRTGEVFISSAGASSVDKNVKITNVDLDSSAAKLFFAHTEESAELASILQSTYAPQGGNLAGVVSSVSQRDPECNLLNIRSNPGDDLFAGEILGILSYTAEFSCVFGVDKVKDTCTKDIGIGFSVKTKTPKADELWSRLVAGPFGIFKRIFPKVGEGGPILKILDIPAATNVTYSGDAVFAGNPPGRKGEDAELYFPHIGGIHEYFLKGIQTALRPKGYGEQVLSGSELTLESSGGNDCRAANDACTPDLDNPPSKNMNCSYGAGGIEGSSELVSNFVKVGNYFGVPPQVLAGVMHIEDGMLLYNYSGSKIKEYSEPGKYDPAMCIPNQCGAVGPMQLSAKPGFDENQCSWAKDNWKEWCHFRSGANDVRNDSEYKPNPANVLDALAVAAKRFKAFSSSSGCGAWSEEDVKYVAYTYYGSCEAPNVFSRYHQLLDNLTGGKARNYAKIQDGSLSYCEFVWGYYDTHR